MDARKIDASGAGPGSRPRIGCGAIAGAFVVAACLVVGAGGPAAAQSLFPLGDKIELERLSDEPVPFKSIGEIPQRPALFLELGDPFLDTGKLGAGFEVCPSSKQMGLLSVFHKGGSGSSLFDVKPLGFDGSSGGFGWSVF